ncbi:maleylpyruvate isomerase family mycothiol-dependent enzyme [Kineosporia babensis]|uniref:Maleylpyruvate isomerase family mycothiol-dependent enzyme n=1 Tax=Kineosporia babensis TaxID=499548 RepID=A0A9X1SS20_9ACTN|nr:maleylpyruvate isomerase family mycothiol-dependent enzyme [Kineosporia babensis]MCD5310149.1 maleylpyruvate isomerase family mycothiol-dependent enzyme [Kineosporia babensis]
METSELRRHLEAEYRRFRAILPGTGLKEIRVPSCPDWSLDDLVQHLGEVYWHKVDCIRRGARPTEEPDLSGLSSVEVLEQGYARLSEMFREYPPDAPAWTWFEPDQSVGFWIRRMAHETAVHRFDAELAVGTPTEIDAALAEDGIDEVLVAMLVSDTEVGDYPAGRPDLQVRTPSRSWFIHFGADGLTVDNQGEAATVIHGGASDLELWLYNRVAGEKLSYTGDLTGMGLLRDLMHQATQ